MHFYAGEINAYAGERKDQKGVFIVGRKMVLSYVYLGEIIPSFRPCVRAVLVSECFFVLKSFCAKRAFVLFCGIF